MNKKVFLSAALLSGAVLFFSACSSKEIRSPEILCLDHGTHRYLGDNEEIYQCAGVDYKHSRACLAAHGGFDDLDFSNRYAQTMYVTRRAVKNYSGAINLSSEMAELKREIDSYLSYAVKLSMIRAFGEAGEQAWSMQKITIPVIYRTFKTNSGESGQLVMVAFYDEKELSPLALLKYLPLEYKMEFMKRRNGDVE